MSKEKGRAKFLTFLFFGLFFISFFSCLSLFIINIVVFLTPIECFDGLFALFNAFWFFGGTGLSFIFAFVGTRFEKKYIDKEDYDVAVKKIRKNLFIMLCSFIVVAGTGVGIYSGVHVKAFSDKRVYTRERWLNGDAERRGEILSNFLLWHKLHAFDQEQVDYYLGTPDELSENHYRYDLGYGMGCLSIDPSTLDIEFSSNAQVVDYHIWS